MNKEISLAELWPIFRRNIKWIAVTAVVCMLLSMLFTVLFVTKKYTSSTKMIASFTKLDPSSDDTPSSVSTGQIDAATSLISTYAAILKSDTVAQRIYDKVAVHWENISVGYVKSSIYVQQSGTTAVVDISVVTTSPELSKEICEAVIEVLPPVVDELYFGQISKLDDASTPTHYSSPSVSKNAAMGLCVGAAAAVVVIFVAYILNNKVMNSEDVEKKYKIPVLGNVPSFDNAKSKKKGAAAQKTAENTDVAKSQGSFFVVESYKNIRTNLLYTLNSSCGENTVAISGAESGVGKSVTCANLAIAFAQSKRKILIIDADMRKPTQHKLFKKSNEEGLSKVLSGQSDLYSSIQRDVAPGLDFLSAGPTPPNPSELLSSDTMTKLVKAVSKDYDCVFIDTPPVNYVTDCLAITNKVSGIVLVARQAYTEFKDFSKAIEGIKTVGGKILGVILSGVRYESNGNNYGKRYDRAYYVKQEPEV